jgi:hypothetical protein
MPIPTLSNLLRTPYPREYCDEERHLWGVPDCRLAQLDRVVWPAGCGARMIAAGRFIGMRAIKWILNGMLLVTPVALTGCETDVDDTPDVEIHDDDSVEEAADDIEDAVD